MPLSFLNPSRSYDSTRRAVRFWGNDSAMEASFFVTEDALKRIEPDMRFDEPGLLIAFGDASRDRHLCGGLRRSMGAGAEARTSWLVPISERRADSEVTEARKFIHVMRVVCRFTLDG